LFVSGGSASPDGSVPAARGGGFIGLRWRIEPAFGGEFTGPCTYGISREPQPLAA
jgi:hypothetical protein